MLMFIVLTYIELYEKSKPLPENFKQQLSLWYGGVDVEIEDTITHCKSYWFQGITLCADSFVPFSRDITMVFIDHVYACIHAKLALMFVD